jgi:hypothetical protein
MAIHYGAFTSQVDIVVKAHFPWSIIYIEFMEKAR